VFGAGFVGEDASLGAVVAPVASTVRPEARREFGPPSVGDGIYRWRAELERASPAYGKKHLPSLITNTSWRLIWFIVGATIVAYWALVTVFAGIIAPHDPFASLGPRLHAPSAVYLLGTDALGRDVFSRVLYGAR